METERPFYLRVGIWRLLVWLLLIVLFCLLFRKEAAALIVPALRFVSDNLAENSNFSLLRESLNAYISSISNTEVEHSAKVMFANAIAYVFFGVSSIYFVSQFALPVRSGEDRRKAFLHLFWYLLWFRRSAILIREGKLIGNNRKLESIHPAVVLVDLSSAIVIERQLKQSFDGDENSYEFQFMRKNKPSNSLLGTLATTLIGLNRKRVPRSRTAGPGLHFTKRGEKITSIVDLRRQSRFGLVEAYTRDGIKISTKVTTLFSLSDNPEIIPVAYLNGNGKESLVELKLEENKQSNTTTIIDHYALSLQDASEIHNFVEYGQVNGESLIYPQTDSLRYFKSPYSFYPERVFDAAYSEALTQSSNLTPWHELPIRVAIDHFRKHLEQFSFDDLHLPNDPDRFPLLAFKEDFNRKVRYEGILAYKLIRPLADIHGESKKWNAYPFETYSIKRAWGNAELEISPPHNLTNSKILRDRGVRVISAGFSELHIVDDIIRMQMVENWKARWDREIDITRARHELEAMRERNRARVQTQREMTYVLSELFKNKAHSKEALAIRVFQALESAAATSEPGKNIAPAEILSMLNNLHEWLLPEKKNITGKDGDESISPPSDSNVNQ